MVDKRHAVIALLADGEFHSGEALGAELGLSRAGVWKHIESLAALGLDIQRVQGRGYRLPQPLELLDADRIRASLAAAVAQRLDELLVEDSVDSTNALLMRRADQGETIIACTAEHQQAGRGRRGRAWISPYAGNLYLSVSWPFRQLPPDFAALSLAMGVGARRALARLGVDGVQLKWPNDIYLAGRKLGGILLEMRGEPPGACRLVAGIGINVAMPSGAAGKAIDQAWTDLQREGHALSRNLLLATLLEEWFAVLEEFAESGFSGFAAEWQQADLLAGKPVTVLEQDGDWGGTALGVARDGALEIDTGAAAPRRVIVGDVSLREATA